MRFLSDSPKVTERYASRMGKEFLKHSPHRKKALVIALAGNLGSGKTTFVRGLTRGMGIRARVLSPTFILYRSHALRNKHFHRLFHMDAYRIRSIKELRTLAFQEMVGDPAHIVVIEWADQIRRAIPRGAVWIRFSHRKNPRERMLQTKRIGR